MAIPKIPTVNGAVTSPHIAWRAKGRDTYDGTLKIKLYDANKKPYTTTYKFKITRQLSDDRYLAFLLQSPLNWVPLGDPEHDTAKAKGHVRKWVRQLVKGTAPYAPKVYKPQPWLVQPKTLPVQK
jgi:hypothetical protein